MTQDFRFDDDYRYFYDAFLTPQITARECDFIASQIPEGGSVLDLGCGYGRITNELASRGFRAVGFDNSSDLIQQAKRDASERGLSAEFREQDIFVMEEKAAFDVVLVWGAIIGMFDDNADQEVLRRALQAVRPGGVLMISTLSRDALAKNAVPAAVIRRGDDVMVDVYQWDLQDGILNHDRLVVREGKFRRSDFKFRMYSFTELRSVLRQLGCNDVKGFSSIGTKLDLSSLFMGIVAHP